MESGRHLPPSLAEMMIKGFKKFADIFEHPRRHLKIITALLYIAGVACCGSIWWFVISPVAGQDLEGAIDGLCTICLSLFYLFRNPKDPTEAEVELLKTLLIPATLTIVQTIATLFL